MYYNLGYYPVAAGYHPSYPYYYASYPEGASSSSMPVPPAPPPDPMRMLCEPVVVPMRHPHLPAVAYDYTYGQPSYMYLQDEQKTSSSSTSSGAHPAVARISKGRLRWTIEMVSPLSLPAADSTDRCSQDTLLKEAVELYGQSGVGMWKKVADFVNAGINYTFVDETGQTVDFAITNHQCGERYKHHIDPSLQIKKKGPWANEEVLPMSLSVLLVLTFFRSICSWSWWTSTRARTKA